MQTGITDLVIPADWNFAKTIEAVTAAGYETIELVLRDSGYFSVDTSESECKALKEQALTAGLRPVSVCSGIRERPRDLMTHDKEAREVSIDAYKICIRGAKAVGAETLLVVLGALTPDLYYDEAYENAVAGMRELAPYAEDMGVKLAIEYVWNKFLLSPIEFARFCDDVGSPNVGFYFDPGNMAIFGYPEHWVRICGRHLMAVHVKDFKREGYQWTPLLEGDVDFVAVMRELRAIGFDGPLVSEVDLSIASLEDTAATIRYIMEM